MLEFAWWWIVFVLPAPWLLAWIASYRQAAGAKDQQLQAVRIPYYQQWTGGIVTEMPQPSKSTKWLLAGMWILLLLASSRPQWVGEPIELPTSGRSIMLAVDASMSMQEEDLIINGRQMNRLDVVKHVLDEFIAQRAGDRLGLILFGDHAYLQTPLTFDLTTIKAMLDESEIGLAGGKTAIGDAIGLTIKRLQNQPDDQRILVLLTDGQDTASRVSPLKAAELAQTGKVKIYTIGIGADQAYRQTMFGKIPFNPSADLDEATLKTIAESTGGQYFRARSTEELQKVYQAINEMEPTEVDKKTYRPTSDLFYYPLIGFTLFWLFHSKCWQLLMPRTYRQRTVSGQPITENNK